MAYLYVGTTNEYANKQRQFTTIQSAIDAAVDGDILVISPGTYNENITCTKTVSFRGNTDDPINNSVYIYGPDETQPALAIKVSPTSVVTMYIEGLKLEKSNESWSRVMSLDVNSNLKLYINKCYISTSNSNTYPIGASTDNNVDQTLNTFEVHNCYIDKGYAHLQNIDWTGTSVEGIFKTELDSSYDCQSCVGSPSTNDNVTTTTSGYGPAYGDYYIELFFGYFEGYVYQESSPVERTVRCYYRDSGEIISETTSSGAGGYFYLGTVWSGSHYMVCLDDEAGESYNDLIIGDIYPTEI